MSVRKLKTTEVKKVREELLRLQGGVCALTRYPLAPKDAVLDHDHKTGLTRAVLHRGVNALLGKLENNHARYGVSLPQMLAMGRGLEAYLKEDYSHMPLHPTHKTTEEKRIIRNAKARASRARKKVDLSVHD